MSESLFDQLKKDVRFIEGMKACINCGTCAAICPGSEFYDYDPRKLMSDLQENNEEMLRKYITSDYIWFCGECMSCKTRCPRGNCPGLVIMALRNLAMDTGLFAESEKGRQQIFMKRVVVGWILKYGYCLYLEGIGTDLYPEQGPVWDWRQKNWADVMERLGANYKGDGPGILRKIPESALDEIHKIFDYTGGTERLEKIEETSKNKAAQMGLEFNDELLNEYVVHVYNKNSYENK
jgi:heterodisulfide reductase subunit C